VFAPVCHKRASASGALVALFAAARSRRSSSSETLLCELRNPFAALSEARRQHVLEEAPEELERVEFHRAPAPAAGLLPAEANASSIERDDARVGDRDAEHVAREVAQRRLAVTDRAGVGNESLAPDGGVDLFEKAGAAHLALELGAEDDRQGADGDEEVRPPACRPAGDSIQRLPSSLTPPAGMTTWRCGW